MTRLPTQFRTSLGPTFELQVFSGRQAGLSDLAPGGGTETSSRCPSWVLCSWGEGTGRLWIYLPPSVTLPTSYCEPVTPALGELTSSGSGFNRMLVSVWQSGQIHALGVTLVCFEAVLVKKRFYRKLLPALRNTESSNAWDNTGYWAALIFSLCRSIQFEAKSPEKSGTFLSFVRCFFRHPESCLNDFAA